MNQGIFVTATGTDVGKTYVSGLLVKALRARGINAGYFKPALSGAEREGGRLVPGDAAGSAGRRAFPGIRRIMWRIYTSRRCPLIWRPGWRVRPSSWRPSWSGSAPWGSGSPIWWPRAAAACSVRSREGEPPLLLADVAAAIGFDLLLVAPSGLGAIHAAVVTAAYAERLGLPVRGILLNRFDEENIIHRDNREQIARFTGLPVAAVPEGAVEWDPPAWLP